MLILKNAFADSKRGYAKNTASQTQNQSFHLIIVQIRKKCHTRINSTLEMLIDQKVKRILQSNSKCSYWCILLGSLPGNQKNLQVVQLIQMLFNSLYFLRYKIQSWIYFSLKDFQLNNYYIITKIGRFEWNRRYSI